jgi:hypothetical protein
VLRGENLATILDAVIQILFNKADQYRIINVLLH